MKSSPKLVQDSLRGMTDDQAVYITRMPGIWGMSPQESGNTGSKRRHETDTGKAARPRTSEHKLSQGPLTTQPLQRQLKSVSFDKKCMRQSSFESTSRTHTGSVHRSNEQDFIPPELVETVHMIFPQYGIADVIKWIKRLRNPSLVSQTAEFTPLTSAAQGSSGTSSTTSETFTEMLQHRNAPRSSIQNNLAPACPSHVATRFPEVEPPALTQQQLLQTISLLQSQLHELYQQQALTPVSIAPTHCMPNITQGILSVSSVSSAIDSRQESRINSKLALEGEQIPSLHSRSRVAFQRPTPRNISLFLPQDVDHLSDFQIQVRKHLEVFAAEHEEVDSSAQGRKKELVLGQVGIRCRHCAHAPLRQRGRGAVYYPAKLTGIYQAAQNMAASHLCESCHCLSEYEKEALREMRDRRTLAGGGKQYWANSCRALGVEETEQGLRFSLSTL